jgi:hypothetical protein
MSIPLGKMMGLTFIQYRQYTTAINMFRTVEAYNSNVSTLRGNGDTGLSYYTFTSTTDEANYTMGQYLLVQNDPNNASKYTAVQKN